MNAPIKVLQVAVLSMRRVELSDESGVIEEVLKSFQLTSFMMCDGAKSDRQKVEPSQEGCLQDTLVGRETRTSMMKNPVVLSSASGRLMSAWIG